MHGLQGIHKPAIDENIFASYELQFGSQPYFGQVVVRSSAVQPSTDGL